jgi:hypothetical protein
MKNISPILIIFLLLLTACTSTQPAVQDAEPPAPPTETIAPAEPKEPTATSEGQRSTWIKLFEGEDYGAFFDMFLTEEEHILLVGTTNHLHRPPYAGDALLMALTLTGDVLWEQTWGGEGYEQAWGGALAEDGGFYIFGETDSYGTGDRDFFLLKTDDVGKENWYRTYGKSRREWPFGMLTLFNGDMLLYGFTESESGGVRNQYAVRVAPTGDVVWEYIDENSDEELIADAIETSEGSIVLAVIVEEDGKLVELDSDGNLLWATRYELPGWQFASQVERTDDGGFLLAGFSMSEDSRRQADTWLAHSTSSGELEWEISFGNDGYDDYAQSLIRLKSGDYLVGGLGNGMPLSRIDSEGNIVWSHSLVAEAVHGAEVLIELNDGGFLIAGFVQLINGLSYDAVLLRTDGEGWVGE